MKILGLTKTTAEVREVTTLADFPTNAVADSVAIIV